MKLSKEKEHLIFEMNDLNLKAFMFDLRNMEYEDHNDFIYDFLNDTSLLFLNCKEKQFKNIIDSYVMDEDMFLDIENEEDE